MFPKIKFLAIPLRMFDFQLNPTCLITSSRSVLWSRFVFYESSFLDNGDWDRVSDENIGEGHRSVGRDLLVFNKRTLESFEFAAMIALILYMNKLHRLQSFNNLSSAKHPRE